jgi:hypothetical protein
VDVTTEVALRKHTVLLGLSLALTTVLVRTPAASERSLALAEEVSIEQAVARVRATGTPTVVAFYKTTCPISRAMFPSLVALARSQPHATFLAFSVDPDSTISRVPNYLSSQGAPFSAVTLRRWPQGAFIRAVSTLGISVGQTWTTPLVAVRDSRGQTIWYREGVRTVAPLASALASLR